MKNSVKDYNDFQQAIQDEELVFLFGTGISSMLTGKSYSWKQWIIDGIERLNDNDFSASCKHELERESSADNMVSVVGKVINAAKKEGSYSSWMHNSFETERIVNIQVTNTLKKLLLTQTVFATTNYDLLLEKATGLNALSYENPDIAFSMLDKHLSTHVLHVHGIYDSVYGIDNIIADEEQYKSILDDQGAQFIQNILGTRTLVFVGCGKTTDDPNISRFISFAKAHLKMEKTYYYLCKDFIDDLPEQIVQIKYGDEYSDLPLFLEDVAQIRLSKKISETFIAGRTAYTDVTFSNDSLLRYHFSYRTIPFCGRETEKGELEKFIHVEEPFLWWAVTGQAGAGKSRLAMEFLFNLPMSWFGFFLNDNITTNDIDNYKPFCNTLIIIDYVAGRERYVADIIYRLRKVFSATYYQLRILLLERDASKAVGSWYSKLMQRMNRADYEIIIRAKYTDTFLNLCDMERNDVESFISAVCLINGVSDEHVSKLYDMYAKKFERLRFRPLYLQLFVEAWINNDYIMPQYSAYTQLIESLLQREQERWVNSVDGDINVCNALIRLMIRANISGRIEIDAIPELYSSDWNIVSDFIKAHSFIGRQKKEWQDTLINSFCHNIDNEHAIIAPQFPDIIKEYMFSYYTDIDMLPDMMKEIWQHSASAFSIFIMRCIMDFPDQEFFKDSINAYNASTNDVEVLLGRLSMLKGKQFPKGADSNFYWGIIDNEYKFWSNIVITDTESENHDQIASLKVTGLYMVAQHIGAWSLYDLSEMEEIIDEMISVKGGQVTTYLQETYLSEHITDLSSKGFKDEVNKNRAVLERMINKDKGEFSDLLKMNNYNNKMMESLLKDNIDEAKHILYEMKSACDYGNLSCVQMLAHSAINIAQFSFAMGNSEGIEIGCRIAVECERLFPEDWTIRARRIGCMTFLLQKQFFEHEIEEKILRGKLRPLKNEISKMKINGSESDDALDISWGVIYTLLINIASENEMRRIIDSADNILHKNPHLTTVATTKITAVSALHREYLHTLVSHEEVEDLYKHVEDNPESENVRAVFFEILEESEDKGKQSDFYSPNIIHEAVNDAIYNPIIGSGISEIDDLLYDIPNEPYVRKHPKIGSNDTCPCGSGKKFKKCCKGKGVYD